MYARTICRRLILCTALAALLLGALPACSTAQDADEHPAPAANQAGGENEEAVEAEAHELETDLLHGNARESLEQLEEFKIDLAIYTFVVFFLLLLILMKFAWRPIMDGLQKREQNIANQIEEARQANEKAGQTLEQYQAKLAAAAEEVRSLIAEGRREAESSRDKILAEAQEAAQRERDRALAEITAAKNQALGEIASTHVDLAFSLARQVVSKEISREEHAQLIRDSLDRFPSNAN